MKEKKSFYATPKDIDRKWLCVDATDQVLGRLSSCVANLLRGKHKATYTPSVDVGDFVVIINAEKIKVTGNKVKDKLYYRHSRYPGGLKSFTFKEYQEKHPARIIYQAIKGMIPHNRLGRQVLTKVKIYSGESHPHQAQNPKQITISG